LVDRARLRDRNHPEARDPADLVRCWPGAVLDAIAVFTIGTPRAAFRRPAGRLDAVEHDAHRAVAHRVDREPPPGPRRADKQVAELRRLVIERSGILPARADRPAERGGPAGDRAVRVELHAGD